MWMSVEAKKDSSSFEEFKENFWRAFQCWDLTFGSIETYDVDLDESELRRIRDSYLNREDYPILNELKKFIIFKNAEDRARWGTDLTMDSEDFNNDLKRGIKKALELARFDLGQVKPKIYQEEKVDQEETRPQKENLSVKDFAEKINKSTKTVKRYVEKGMIRANTNEDGRILGIPRSELDAFLNKTV